MHAGTVGLAHHRAGVVVPRAVANWQSAKTHCPHGHEYGPDSRRPDGSRKCPECHRQGAIRAARARGVKPRSERNYRVGHPLQPRLAGRTKLIEPIGCIHWTGPVAKDGYARISFNGKEQLLHRVMFFVKHGRWPEPQAMHTCDVHWPARDRTYRRCINPDHIEEGTSAENTRQMFAKKRNWQAQVTHCPRGHAYAEHGYIGTDGHRRCLPCKRIAARKPTSSKAAT